MNKLPVISLILAVFGIGMMLFVGLSGIGAPQPTSFVTVNAASDFDESIPSAVLTDNDRERFPVLFHAIENGITHIDVYYPDVPEGGMPEREYYAISDLYDYTGTVFYTGPGYIVYEGDLFLIHIGDIAGKSGFEESIANFLRFASKALIFAGVILFALGFVRSLSSTAPKSRAMQIQTCIEEHPGCSEADIVRNTGYSRNSVVHHIRTLLRDNRIREAPYHKTVRYYPTGESNAETDFQDAASAKEKPAAILSALGTGSMTVSELARQTGLSEPSLRWHLSRLEEDGLVTLEKQGHSIRYSRRDSLER